MGSQSCPNVSVRRRVAQHPLVTLLMVGMLYRVSLGFTMFRRTRPIHTIQTISSRSRVVRFMFEEKASFHRRNEEPDGDDNNSKDGPNWIERSFPVSGTDEEIKATTVLDYNLGISGKSYQTGPLAARMYQAMTERSQVLEQVDDEQAQELRQTFKTIALDCAAKEAVRAALLENGLEMVLLSDEDEVGEWGSVDSIRLVDESGALVSQQIYDDWEEVMNDWMPGQGFDFIARQVPAKMRPLSMDELLQALDPKGELRQQAKESGMSLPEVEEDLEELNGPQSLEELATVNVQRVNAAPREAVTEQEAFAGDVTKRGYRPIHASALAALNEDGTLVHSTVMHVMDALVSHGCLIVDVTDGGKSFEKAMVVAEMWATTERFFERVDKGDLPEEILGMKTAEEVGSTHAKVGFASYDNNNMQFLETRLARTGRMLPAAVETIVGKAGCQSLKAAFTIFTDFAKDVTRTVVATGSQEVGALDDRPAVLAATKLVNELLDDGTPIKTDIKHSEVPVSMSPHRLCRYSNGQTQTKEENQDSFDTREIFGAHTDSTFITAVPVALVPGLEVYDEAEDKWYRPEKAARIYWEDEQRAQGKDPASMTETMEDGSVIPWCARYSIMMPGELLQLFSRNEVLATVHRVVATQVQPSRLSAPILVRGRPGTSVDVKRYLGGSLAEAILNQCKGRRIEDIYDLMQVQSFQ